MELWIVFILLCIFAHLFLMFNNEHVLRIIKVKCISDFFSFLLNLLCKLLLREEAGSSPPFLIVLLRERVSGMEGSSTFYWVVKSPKKMVFLQCYMFISNLVISKLWEDGLLYSFDFTHHSLSTSLFNVYSKNILYFSCPGPKISHILRDLVFLLVESNI
jgi:hypothetical protein